MDAKYRDLLMAINGAFLSFIIVNASDKFSWLNFNGANPTTTESTFVGLKGKSEKSWISNNNDINWFIDDWKL